MSSLSSPSRIGWYSCSCLNVDIEIADIAAVHVVPERDAALSGCNLRTEQLGLVSGLPAARRLDVDVEAVYC